MGLLYQKRRLKANKIRRQIASCRANIRRLRVLLSFVLIVLIIFAGIKILKLPQWYIDCEKLYHADPSVLTISGNTITPDYKIINIIRQSTIPDIQIFRFDTRELEESICQLQTIKKVYIRRYWFPARLAVTVDERVPVFLLAPNLQSEPNSALTTDGVLIDHDYFPFKTQVKAKKLLTYGVKDGVDEIWDKKKVDEIIKLTKALEMYSNQEVQYIDYRNRQDVYIMLRDYLIRFGEINDTSLNRAKYIALILPQAEKYGKKTKYIDLRWDDSRYIRLEGEKEISENDSKPASAASSEDKNKQKEENKPQEEIQEEQTSQQTVN